MNMDSHTIKAAWITGGATIFAAVIGGVFLLFSSNNNDTDLSNNKLNSKKEIEITAPVLKDVARNSEAFKIVLPSNLKNQISIIDAESIDYPNRKNDLDTLQRFIQNGKFDMAEFTASQIIKQQNNLRKIQSGLPKTLDEKLEIIREELIAYPNRNSDLDTLQRFIQNGKLEMAEFTADQIIIQQRNLRSVNK